jgi:signal transduction histidine kinase
MSQTPRGSALRVALAFAILAGTWVFVVHFILNWLLMQPVAYVRYDAYSDVVIAALTAGLVYFLLRREFSAREQTNTILRHAQKELEERVEQRTAALAAESAVLQAVIETVPAGLALFAGSDLQLKWANKEYRQILPEPFRAHGIAGASLGSLFPETAQQEIVAIFSRVAAIGEGHFDAEYAYPRAGQALAYWQWAVVPLPAASGVMPDLLMLAHDITELVLARKRLEELHGEVARRVEDARQARADAETRAGELATVLDVSLTLTSTLLYRPLLERILDQLLVVVGYTNAAVLLCDEVGFSVAAYRGPLPEESIVGTRLALNLAVSYQEMLDQGKPVIVPDLAADTALARGVRDTTPAVFCDVLAQARSWMGVPLVIQERVIGFFQFDHVEPDYFTAHHAHLAQGIANQAAIALENARLYAEARQFATLEERQRVARELHDSVSQALYGISLAAHAAHAQMDRAPEKLRNTLSYLLSLSDNVVTEMQALVFELHPDSLEQLGLIVGLTKLAEATRVRAEVEVGLDLGPEPDVALDSKQVLYRIAQEALHNVEKHAQAQRVDIELHMANNALTLIICDDGVGFDPSSQFPGHFGLRSMRERVVGLGGSLKIESTSGRGVIVRATIPCSPVASLPA